MGLPIWRDPEEHIVKKDAAKHDPTAAARSSIRRRSSVHGRRGTRPRLPRETSRRPDRSDRPTSPPTTAEARSQWRRTDVSEFPPINTLLESAGRPSDLAPPRPPPAPESRSQILQRLDETERALRDQIAHVQETAARLDQNAREIGVDLARSADRPRRLSRQLRQLRSLTELRISRFIRPVSPDPREETSASRHSSVLHSPPLDRSRSRDSAHARESGLPTPPHNASENTDSLFLPDQAQTTDSAASRSTHPLSNSWRPESPINGLGDRNRSPTPADGWEIMRTTIPADDLLPSADSSFASAAASQSFSSNQTTPNEGTQATSAGDESDSASSLDPDDLVCNDEEREATASFARHVYAHELSSEEGFRRIAHQEALRYAEGNRFLLAGEPDCVEIGFRLINDALDTPEGRERVFRLSQNSRALPEVRGFEEWIFGNSRDRPRTRLAHVSHDDDDVADPRSEHATTDDTSSVRVDRVRMQAYARMHSLRERNIATARALNAGSTAIREARSRLNDYLHRYNPEVWRASRGRLEGLSADLAPPSYEPLASHPDVNTFTSRDAPEAHRVSPPSPENERDVADAFLSGDEQDLSSVRRIAQRLERRDDVPSEWWMSMGLNLSRTRARSRSPPTVSRDRVRTGRIDRQEETSRL